MSRVRKLSRRRFLGSASGIAAATVAAGAIGAAPIIGTQKTRVLAEELNPLKDKDRRDQACRIRTDAANYQKSLPLVQHPTNADEALVGYVGSFSKALPHNNLGEVTKSAYDALRKALKSGLPADFDAIPLGGSAKLANPQAAFAYDLVGKDSNNLSVAAAPALKSAWAAGEMVEMYWRALTRDVPFSEYGSNSLIAQACSDLSALSDFRGPRDTTGAVAPATIFRSSLPGDLSGPFISQFLLKPVVQGATTFVQQYHFPSAGDDYLTNYQDWLNTQNGILGKRTVPLADQACYIRNGRDLAEWVHFDYSYQAFLNACLVLLSMKAPIDAGNPYRTSANQGGFGTFGAPHVLDMVARAACAALKASWYQKWLVHRRLRPEEYGGRVHNQVLSGVNYGLHADVLNSAGLAATYSKYGTYLLPMAYPEGCPIHPSYVGGHATIAGACVTVLKAFFDESWTMPAPVQASSDGLALESYAGQLTVGNELNKLAANVGLGRDMAGMHWRSDETEAFKLGEDVAINMLIDMNDSFNETFAGFSLTKFDGTTVTVQIAKKKGDAKGQPK